MITTQYKGHKVQIVPGKKGAVNAKVGGVIVATGCVTAQEARAAARQFIHELESGGDYAVTPVIASAPDPATQFIDELAVETKDLFVMPSSSKKGGK